MTLQTLFPVESLAALTRHAATLGLIVRREPSDGLTPAKERLIQVYPKGESTSAAYALTLAEAAAYVAAWVDSKVSTFGRNSGNSGAPRSVWPDRISDCDKARAVLKAALASVGVVADLAEAAIYGTARAVRFEVRAEGYTSTAVEYSHNFEIVAEAAEELARKVAAELESVRAADQAEGLDMGTERVTASGVMISGGPLDQGQPVAAEEPAAKAPRIVDLTPTWAALLPAILAVLDNGAAEGARMARAELARMATAADQACAADKVKRAALEKVKTASAEAVAAVAALHDNGGADHDKAAEGKAEAALDLIMAEVERFRRATEPTGLQAAADQARAASALAADLAQARQLIRASEAEGFDSGCARGFKIKAAVAFRRCAHTAEHLGLTAFSESLFKAAALADQAEEKQQGRA